MKRYPEPFHGTWQPVFPADAHPLHPTNRLNWYEGVEFPPFPTPRPADSNAAQEGQLCGHSAAAGTVLLILTTPLYVGAQKDSGSQKSEAEQLVDAFNKVFGAHRHTGYNHSKSTSYWMGLSRRVRRLHP